MRRVALLGMLAACRAKASVVVDADDAQGKVVAWLARHGITATVTCPGDVPLEDGKRFECQATEVETKQQFPLTLAITDNAANLEISANGEVMTRSDVEAWLRKQVNTGTCKFTIGSQRGHIAMKLTAEDEKNHEVSMTIVED